MAKAEVRSKARTPEDDEPLHFDVSTGLKRVLGRELITNEEVAIFEMVKNSFDADANNVQIFFGDDSIIVADIQDVVPKRNDLGHKVLLPDGRTMAIAVIGGEKTISIDEMRDLRRLILNLRGEFRALRDALRN